MADSDTFHKGEPATYGPLVVNGTTRYRLAWPLADRSPCNSGGTGRIPIRTDRGEVLVPDCDEVTPLRRLVDDQEDWNRVRTHASRALARFMDAYPVSESDIRKIKRRVLK